MSYGGPLTLYLLRIKTVDTRVVQGPGAYLAHLASVRRFCPGYTISAGIPPIDIYIPNTPCNSNKIVKPMDIV
jgi:hypothetical protein